MNNRPWNRPLTDTETLRIDEKRKLHLHELLIRVEEKWKHLSQWRMSADAPERLFTVEEKLLNRAREEKGLILIYEYGGPVPDGDFGSLSLGSIYPYKDPIWFNEEEGRFGMSLKRGFWQSHKPGAQYRYCERDIDFIIPDYWYTDRSVPGRETFPYAEVLVGREEINGFAQLSGNHYRVKKLREYLNRL